MAPVDAPTLPPDAGPAKQPYLDIAGRTDRGLVRKANEDAFLITELNRRMNVLHSSLPAADLDWLTSSSAGTVLVVADGMGGQGGGHVASRVAVRSITDYVCSVMPWASRHAQEVETSPRATLPGVRDQLSTALVAGNTEVRQAAGLPGASPNMGTTLTLAYILWPRMYVAHAGDSRCYLLRHNLLSCLTTDHTVAEQMRAQGFPALEASSPLHHILWNALGTSEDEMVPEMQKQQLEAGDIILLCTDGLTKHVDEDEITNILANTDTSEEACDLLIERTVAGGASDNVTVVVARVPPEPTPD
ncbi:MAG: protein phosphatase 2C domain-containing protein [Polyangiaceae bacterium]